MKAQVVIEHNESNGRTFANIATYLCTPEQQKQNATFLPSDLVAAPATPQAPVTVGREHVAAPPAEPQVTPPVAQPDEYPASRILTMIDECKKKSDVDAISLFHLEGTSKYTPKELEVLTNAAARKKESLAE